ncbi:methyltransferase-like protein 27 [Acropora muricata]|uniref:methyltransferase-like protein 27 n=1 Tax=Acropora muricata TaxID=159855 RepID=UPI0034E44DFC
MAISTHKEPYMKYFGRRFENLSHDSTYEDVKELYDEYAEAYDKEAILGGCAYCKPLAELLDRVLTNAFPNKAKHELKIIDAGAGTGAAAIELQKLGYSDLHALDVSQEMLNEAKKKGIPYKRLICAALTEIAVAEIETGEFDGLISAGVLVKGHVRSSALTEMIRMVKNGGFLCFNIRCNELEDYEPKMVELEKAGMWENISKTTITYFKNEDLPKEALGFVFKVSRSE